MTTAWLVVSVLIGAYLVAVIEEWTVRDRFSLVLPLLAGVALLGRESLLPRRPDRLLFESAPVPFLAAAVLAAALPVAPGGAIVNLATRALFINAALAPFHFWAPDAYDGAPVAVAAFLSIVPKIGAIFALAQVARDLPVRVIDWPLVVAVLAVVSMTYGNLAALGQTNVVRLLAYSSIAQAGYFLLGVVGIGQGSLPVQSLVVFAAAYAAMNLGAFAVVARVGRDLAAYDGLGRTAPWTGTAMTVFLLSLVGVPPLAGFAGKLLLFGAAIDAGYTWLAVAAILNSVLSLAVYMRVVAPMYRPVTGALASRPAASRSIASVGALALGGTVGLGVGVQILLTHI